MSRNKPAMSTWTAFVAIPGGAKTLHFCEFEEAERYNADPDLWAAEMYGMTKAEYLEWINLDGAPLCRAETKNGRQCRNVIGRTQQCAREWKALHRKGCCVAHGNSEK
jgi:hypothetical protein